MSSSIENDRRNAPRYPVCAYASLQTTNNKWNAHLLDISATGARLAILDEHFLKADDTVSLHLELEELTTSSHSGKYLVLAGKIVHVRDHIVGILLEDLQPEHQMQLKTLLTEFAQMRL